MSKVFLIRSIEIFLAYWNFDKTSKMNPIWQYSYVRSKCIHVYFIYSVCTFLKVQLAFFIMRTGFLLLGNWLGGKNINVLKQKMTILHKYILWTKNIDDWHMVFWKDDNNIILHLYFEMHPTGRNASNFFIYIPSIYRQFYWEFVIKM